MRKSFIIKYLIEILSNIVVWTWIFLSLLNRGLYREKLFIYIVAILIFLFISEVVINTMNRYNKSFFEDYKKMATLKKKVIGLSLAACLGLICALLINKL